MFQLRVNNEERNSFRFGCIESNVLIRRLFISCRRCCRRSCFRSRCRPSHRSRRCRRRCRCPAPIQTKSWDSFQLKIPQFGGFINFQVVLKTEKNVGGGEVKKNPPLAIWTFFLTPPPGREKMR